MMDNLRYLYFRFRPVFVVIGTILTIFLCASSIYVGFINMFSIVAFIQRWFGYFLVAVFSVLILLGVNEALPRDARKKKKNESTIIPSIMERNRRLSEPEERFNEEMNRLDEDYQRRREMARENYNHELNQKFYDQLRGEKFDGEL